MAHRIKKLAQELPGKVGYLKPGIYENLDPKVIEYQRKLGNLLEIEEVENKEETSFVLELNIESKEEPKIINKRKIRRNTNDNSN